jgi:hypothetical protein
MESMPSTLRAKLTVQYKSFSLFGLRDLCRTKNVGFEVPCGSGHSSLQHHVARRAAADVAVGENLTGRRRIDPNAAEFDPATPQWRP